LKNIQIPDQARVALAEGNLALANEILGKPYSIKGRVIEGLRLGRQLGFPTANLELVQGSRLFLAHGVYAVKVLYGTNIYDGMANIGTRPTLNLTSLSIEVNLFGFHNDLYGKTLTVFFVERIRDEKKFSGLEELQKNILSDKQKASEILKRWSEFYPDTE